METYLKYLNEGIKMTPKKVAKNFGKEILKKSKTGYENLIGSKVDNLSVVVFDYLQNQGNVWKDLAEKMSDSDLKETAKEIIKLYEK